MKPTHYERTVKSMWWTNEPMMPWEEPTDWNTMDYEPEDEGLWDDDEYESARDEEDW